MTKTRARRFRRVTLVAATLAALAPGDGGLRRPPVPTAGAGGGTGPHPAERGRRGAGGPRRGAHAGHEDRRRPGGDPGREPRPGDALPAERDARGQRPVGQRPRRRLLVLQHPRDRPDPPQRHPRRRAAPGPGGPGPLLLQLRRLRERRGLDPGPARGRHVERGLGLVRRLGELREREPRRPARSRGAGGRRLVGDGPRDARRALGPPGRGLGPLRPPVRADDRRLPRALRGGPGHRLLRRHPRGRAVPLQAVRLLGARAHRARVPRHRRGDARDGPPRERPHPRREGPLRPGLRAGPVHPARGRWDDAHRAGLLQRRPGLVPHLGRGPGEPPAVRDRRPLRGPRARGDPPRGEPGPQLGRPRQRLHARPLHGRGGRLARLPQHRPQERVQHVPEGHAGTRGARGCGPTRRCATRVSSTGATSRSGR